MIHSSSFVSLKKYFFNFVLKGSFIGYRILGGGFFFFPFTILKMSLHCLLTSFDGDEKYFVLSVFLCM